MPWTANLDGAVVGSVVYISSGTSPTLARFRMFWPERQEIVSSGHDPLRRRSGQAPCGGGRTGPAAPTAHAKRAIYGHAAISIPYPHWRSAKRWIFPLGVLGRSGTKAISRG